MLAADADAQRMLDRMMPITTLQKAEGFYAKVKGDAEFCMQYPDTVRQFKAASKIATLLPGPLKLQVSAVAVRLSVSPCERFKVTYEARRLAAPMRGL